MSGDGYFVARVDEERCVGCGVCVLDYFPTFRRQELRRPRPSEMLNVKRTLEGAGLRTVVVQTAIGHFGPR